MDQNKVNDIIKKQKKKIYTVIFFYVLFSIFSYIILKNIALVITALLLVIFVIAILIKLYQVKFIIDDLCDPELYYYVYLGLNKKEPILNDKLKVAELMGDYDSAIQIAYSLLNSYKRDIQKADVVLKVIRISFDSGDFELCQKAIFDFNSLNVNDKIKNSYSSVIGFYSSYINGDYEDSRKYLDQTIDSIKNKKISNLLKYKLEYYEGLVNYVLGNKELAEEKLNSVINNCPKLNIAILSKEIIETGSISHQCDLSGAIQKDISYTFKKEKIETWRIVCFILAIIGMILSCIALSNETNYKGSTIEDSILSYNSDFDNSISDLNILKNISFNDNHIVAICESDNGKLIIAYLNKTAPDSFECASSYSFEDWELEKDIVFSKYYLYSSGNSQKLHFTIALDKNDISNGYEIIEIEHNNKILYFGYYFDDAKYHFFNSSGVEIIED